MEIGLVFSFTSSILALVAVVIVYLVVKKEGEGTQEMRKIASYIREGAKAFLRREGITMSYFIVALSFIILLIIGWQMALGFFLGSVLSFLAAYFGMMTATLANVRTANTARSSARKALKIAFLGGSVTGLLIVSSSLLGITLLYILFKDPKELVGFGFGASLAALFAQLGGGIYTKAADIGADLVGKVEKRIPEDDPRNPAVIADLVGDNVGDCAGRGADLFESFSDNIIAIMILGLAFMAVYGIKMIFFPLIVQSIGIFATLAGVLSMREWKNPFIGINIPLIVTTAIAEVGFYWIGVYYMNDISLFYCLTIGLITSIVVALIVQYYTSVNQKPVYEIAKSAQSGAAIDVLSGLAYGMESAISPIIVIAVAVLISYIISGFYGVAAATAGILATTGIIMSSDTFGPIADNADGIADMSGIKAKGTEILDAIGNMTKAITKGYAMSCAVMSALVMLFAYAFEAHITTINLTKPVVLSGLFLGAALPFLFSGLTIKAVNKGAYKIVNEVRRQFREIKGLLEGKAKADYGRCVDITTKNALKGMLLPTTIALVFPVLIGLFLGTESLGAYLASTTISGALLALFMYNSGGALDNAKKYIEDGHFGGKGTETHAASVVGDTVGDPLKDTAGPSLHILIKLQNIMALTFLPIFMTYALII